MSDADSEVDSIFSRLNCSGAHACYCERSTDGGCKTAITNLIAQEANKAVVAKNNAYWERNQLVGVLSRLYPSHLARHDENDKDWEDDWRNIVCIHTPVGQATWHLQDNDMPMFAHLKRGADHWDGHTTEEKYHRLSRLTADKEKA